eukprot:Gregarina_sp_Poly_1__8832@NODE_530_length_7661_cov_56_450619_g420_i0_p2_GENE_NODE_530_length_7661_cov_56_450619_g420_i0NODE_530_length_7661_cov_56_450619_g420_i0_p2_ORF_typecomplete_len589_score117_85Not3/PF04065_15/3_2e30DUF484/PF04340_12/2_6e03DUF484/PF04340_12/0_019RRF/PF01765_19/0_073SH3_1/PF00018_28/0_066AAA_13/PF13166_6/0_085SH3_2/PF07653_17/0_19Ribosomal_L10/PF00466_20/0_63Ribosomal_L10/PF00466_20/2_2e03Herpes_ICP4_N/PF03584_15/3_5Herpes_ICP4_N/PF03584_15/57Vir_act_alpha_C/PF10400_9/57Vir
MSKKLAGEIEKCLRESQQNMQIYDVKWRELKSYNEATANPDWAVLGSGVIKCNSPELVILSGLKSKRLPAGPSVITVDISNMSEKQVSEVKEKLKGELEALMKKVYRSRQQLMDWIQHADLRQTGFTKEHLTDARKEIESRHRKGKVYYLKNISSEDTSNEQASQFNEVIQWMQLYIDKLRDKSDQFTAEIETLSRKANESDRISLLNGAVEMYLMHANRLDEFLRGIRNNTIYVQRSGEEHEGTSEESLEAGGGGDGVELLLNRLAELKELLTPFVADENDDLLYVVQSEVYDDLGIVAGIGRLDGDTETAAETTRSPATQNEIVKPASPSRQSPQQSPSPLPSPSSQPPPPSALPWSSRQVTADAVETETTSRFSSGDLETLASGKGVSYRTILQHTKPVAAVETLSPSIETNGSQLETRLAIEKRLASLEAKLETPPGWSDGGRLVLSQGVTSNVCDGDLLAQLSPSARERLLQQVESLLTTPAANRNLLPVLVLDAKVAVLSARHSWNGEVSGGGPEITQRILAESSLLYVEEGAAIEVLAAVPRERWTFGRLAADRNKQGWFPTHVIQ